MALYLDATQYLQKAAPDKLLGVADTALPTAYLALCTGDPGDAGSLSTEVVGGGYGRQIITSKMSAFSFSGNEAVSTLGAFVQFAIATAAWGAITHIAICDASSAGNVQWKGELEEARTIAAGSAPIQFVAGAIVIRIRSSNMTEYALEKIGDHFLGKTNWPMPSACDMHLFEANPTSAGSFSNEADYGDYAAVEVTSKMAATVLATGIARNDDDVQFATPSSGSNIITYTGISDGAGSPTLLLFSPLRRAFAVNNGDSVGPLFRPGAIAVQMT